MLRHQAHQSHKDAPPSSVRCTEACNCDLYWRKLSVIKITHSDKLVNLSRDLIKLGIKEHDALHVAAALTANAELFITTDDRLARKIKTHGQLRCALPWDALACLENWYEN